MRLNRGATHALTPQMHPSDVPGQILRMIVLALLTQALWRSAVVAYRITFKLSTIYTWSWSPKVDHASTRPGFPTPAH